MRAERTIPTPMSENSHACGVLSSERSVMFVEKGPPPLFHNPSGAT